MKRILSLVLLLALLLCGCDRSMNWVISNEPSVRGIVEEVGEDWVLLRVTEADDPAYVPGNLVRAEKATRLNDCKFAAEIGDEVAVYHDGTIEAADVPQLRNVHGYVIINPANREVEE